MKSTGPKRFRTLSGIRRELLTCRACPRLVKFRESVKPRATFRHERYWRKPVPGFGDTEAELVVVGLAPAAQGGNRTGRVFTGDSSGRFLVKALHRAGFANQAVSESRDDGLVYKNCYLTAAVKCAPPGDRPSSAELDRCAHYLDAELDLLRRTRVILALGSVALRAVAESERRSGHEVPRIEFEHGARCRISGGRLLVASYHPSPRNTNTGKLTEEMLTGLLNEIGSLLRSESARPSK